MLNHKKISPIRSVDQAADRLRAAILAGDYAPGSFLPPERTLAALLGLSRLTLRAALSRLETEGLLRPRHGEGVRVLDFRASGHFDLYRHLIGPADRERVSAFLELGRAVAAGAVALACRRATPAARAHLAELAALQAAEPDPAAFTARDLAFGRAVLRAAGNPAMELLLNT